MLFCYYGDNYYSNKRAFLNDYSLSYGMLATFKINKKLSPNTTSAIDRSKLKSYIKLHQEYLERVRIAHNFSKDEQIKLINIINNEIISVNRNIVCYGYNEEYGYMDTTGTASGLRSTDLREKAILELIEKNEVLLLWYKLLGYRVKKNTCIEDTIKSIGFNSKEVFIYASNSISNFTTYTVLLFDDKKIIATGSCCHKNTYVALKNALLEAKLLESTNLYYMFNKYKNMTEDEYRATYNHVQILEKKLPCIQFNQFDVDEIKFPSWLSSLEICVLNTKEHHKWVTVRCLSKDLINAVPTMGNIIGSTNKKMFKVFNLSIDDIDMIPSCIVL